MLYNIMVLLEELVKQNAPKEPPKPKEELPEEVVELETPEEPPKLKEQPIAKDEEKCKHCGKVHKNFSEKMICAKKHKKKG